MDDYSLSFTTGDTADTQRGTLQTYSPYHGATDVPLNAVVELRINERIDSTSPISSAIYLHDSTDGSRVATDLTISEDGRHIRLTPQAPLNAGHRYYVSFGNYPNYLYDLAGNTFSSRHFYFTAGDSRQTETPQVTDHNLSQGTEAVALNSWLRIQLDKPLNSVCTNNSTVTLRDSNDADSDSIAGSVSLNSSRSLLTFNPTGNLAANTEYTLTLSGVCDLTGELLDDYSLSFTTGDTADTQRGYVQTYSPYHDATDVPLNAVIGLRTSERVDPTSLDTVYLYNLSESSNVALDRSLSEDGRGIQLVPQASLNAGQHYRAYMGSSLSDLAGNLFNNRLPSNYYSYFDFTVGENNQTLMPEVISHNLQQDTNTVALNSWSRIQLDKPLSAFCVGNSTVTLRDSRDGNTIKGTVNLSGDLHRITFDPTEDLTANTDYTLTLSGVCDLTGKLLDDYSLSFTTGDTADTQRGSIRRYSPVHNASDVAVDSPIELSTSKPIDPTSLTSVYLHSHTEDRTVAVDRILSDDGRTVRLIPRSPLSTGHFYRVYAGSSLYDPVGNLFDNRLRNNYYNYFDFTVGERGESD